MMMSPISDDITAYLPRPLPPPTSVELHHQLPLHHQQHQQQQQQRRWKPSSASEVAPNCPRCDSANTKFCYYNNYSLAQPRYFCKGCRRYWTKGGSLRNVPVGGGCRKNRRGRSSSMRVHGDSRGRAEQTGPSAAQQQQHPGNSAGMLEDIAGSGGNNAAAASSTTSSSGGTSRASEGSDIDLAVLYAKYLSDQSSEQESSPESQQLGAMELPAAADPTVILDVEPTVFEFDYAALGHHLPCSDEAAGHFATSSVITSSEAAQLHDMGFDGGVGQFQFLMPETDGLSSGVDDSFWVNSLPIGSGNSTWLQQQCPGEQFVLPMIPDQQTDPMGPLAHHQSMLLGGGGSWAAIDPWSIDAVTRL